MVLRLDAVMILLTIYAKGNHVLQSKKALKLLVANLFYGYAKTLSSMTYVKHSK